MRNKSVRTGIRSQQKKLRAAVAAGNKEKAITEYDLLASRLDKAAKRGVVHGNLASRRKSRAARLIATTSSAAQPAAAAESPTED